MTTQPRRLGRGLEALLSRPMNAPDPGAQPGAGQADGLAQSAFPRPELRVAEGTESSEAAGLHPATSGGLPMAPVALIDANPFQPRQEFDEAGIDELAESLREHGLLQPLVVRRLGERYQLVAGERRLRAAIKAGWTEAPVQIREADDRQMAELAIVENLQRRDLNPLEKAASFQHYLDRYRVTQTELAARLKVDRSTIANLVRLLELPEPVQQAIRSGAVTQGHARALLPLGDEREQLAMCERIEREQLSVRSVELQVQDMLHRGDDELPAPSLAIAASTTSAAPHAGAAGSSPAASSPKTRKAPRRSEQIALLEQEFRGVLGTRVSIRQTTEGRGKIVIPFTNNEEFERLRDLICGPEVGVL